MKSLSQSLRAIILLYLLSNNSLGEGKFPGFSLTQQRHLAALSGGFLFIVAFSYWLSRYELLYSSRGVAYGASYTDVTTQLPISTAALCHKILALVVVAKEPLPFDLVQNLLSCDSHQCND